MELLLVLSLVSAAVCFPSGNVTRAGHRQFFPEDYAFLSSLPRSRIGTNLPGFHYIFVDATGQISRTRGPLGSQIEVAGSPRSSDAGIRVAADIVAKMTHNMPSTVFHTLASKAGVGVFTASETMTVFPEYANLANGNCGSSCTGTCAHTCTFDGRKWETVAGVGGPRGVILEDNVLCTDKDPYRKQDNILSHEFTHTIHGNALPASVTQQIDAAYNNAKAHSIWTLSSYAMSNSQEYLAEGGSVYFGVSIMRNTNGGMNQCSGQNLCAGEQAGRAHLHAVDPNLYNVLTYIFTNNRPQLLSGLTICPSGTVVG